MEQSNGTQPLNVNTSDVYQLSALKDKAWRNEEEARNTYKMAVEKVRENWHSDDIKNDLTEIRWGRAYGLDLSGRG
jgi:hypothetical protein